jgi:hypothetical protein
LKDLTFVCLLLSFESGWLNYDGGRLRFNVRKVDDVLNRVGKYYPVGRADLEGDNKLLFERLKSEVSFLVKLKDIVRSILSCLLDVDEFHNYSILPA